MEPPPRRVKIRATHGSSARRQETPFRRNETGIFFSKELGTEVTRSRLDQPGFLVGDVQ
jgi:hypothetical protein